MADSQRGFGRLKGNGSIYSALREPMKPHAAEQVRRLDHSPRGTLLLHSPRKASPNGS